MLPVAGHLAAGMELAVAIGLIVGALPRCAACACGSSMRWRSLSGEGETMRTLRKLDLTSRCRCRRHSGRALIELPGWRCRCRDPALPGVAHACGAASLVVTQVGIAHSAAIGSSSVVVVGSPASWRPGALLAMGRGSKRRSSRQHERHGHHHARRRAERDQLRGRYDSATWFRWRRSTQNAQGKPSPAGAGRRRIAARGVVARRQRGDSRVSERTWTCVQHQDHRGSKLMSGSRIAVARARASNSPASTWLDVRLNGQS